MENVTRPMRPALVAIIDVGSNQISIHACFPTEAGQGAYARRVKSDSTWHGRMREEE